MNEEMRSPLGQVKFSRRKHFGFYKHAMSPAPQRRDRTSISIFCGPPVGLLPPKPEDQGPAPSDCIDGQYLDGTQPHAWHTLDIEISTVIVPERGNRAWLPGERHLSQAARIILKLDS